MIYAGPYLGFSFFSSLFSNSLTNSSRNSIAFEIFAANLGLAIIIAFVNSVAICSIFSTAIIALLWFFVWSIAAISINRSEGFFNKDLIAEKVQIRLDQEDEG